MIYVHVPFCRSFCTYCDFYSEVASKCRDSEQMSRQEKLFDSYLEAVRAEIGTRKDEISRVFASNDANTLYFGGGTPSVLPLSAFERILDALEDVGVRTDFREFTIEVNPEDVVANGLPYIKGLQSLGVNRISMGVQSFDDKVLKFMNRRHSADDAIKAYRILEEAGFENISIDLIFGLPQLSDELWGETLEKALNISSRGISPAHISSYQLSVEPGSMLAKMVQRGLWKEAEEEQCARQYEQMCQTLGKAGYHHYEISSFARPGFEAVHNSAYWKRVPYVGLGPGAHSFIGFSERKWNKEDLTAYIEAGRTGDFSLVSDGETLDREQMVMEQVMLGLRTSDGVPQVLLKKHCDSLALEQALGCGDLVVLKDSRVRIPESRFFVSDSIISDLL